MHCSLNVFRISTVRSVEASSHTINSSGRIVWARILSSCSWRYVSPLQVHMATEIFDALFIVPFSAGPRRHGRSIWNCKSSNVRGAWMKDACPRSTSRGHSRDRNCHQCGRSARHRPACRGPLPVRIAGMKIQALNPALAACARYARRSSGRHCVTSRSANLPERRFGARFPLVCPANMGYSALIHVHLSIQPGAGCIPASVCQMGGGVI